MFEMFKLKMKLNKAEQIIEALEIQNAELINNIKRMRDCFDNRKRIELQPFMKQYRNEGIYTLADRLKIKSVLVVDELYITIEESELDELVKELTGGVSDA